MPYALRPPPALPSTDLRACSDAERYIAGGQLWCLQTIQQRLTELKVIYSGNAETDALTKLAWTQDTPKAFISQLSRARYQGSQWCYTTKGRIPYPSDVYIMGFNRHTGVENQKTDPWVYFKFSIVENSESIIILSSHPERIHG
jgi:hypothetical protein